MDPAPRTPGANEQSAVPAAGRDVRVERVFKGPGFAETLYLCIRGGERFIRKQANPDARPFSRLALCREIALLRSLPSYMAAWFPSVLETSLPADWRDPEPAADPLYYDMPWYPTEGGWTPLSRLLLKRGASVEASLRGCLRDIMDTVAGWYARDAVPPAGDYAERTMLAAMRESVAFATVDPVLGEIVNGTIRVNGRPVPDRARVKTLVAGEPEIVAALTPARDRFLHGDFFPENVLYNTRTGAWLLLDPVSVRGVFRGDVVLDLEKMGSWLAGELPALRSGHFSVSAAGGDISFRLRTGEGPLAGLAALELDAWYERHLADGPIAGVLSGEPGWERRRPFITAFYSLCMLPLVDSRQALARYALALESLRAFDESA